MGQQCAVVLVDNGSHDETGEKLRAHALSAVLPTRVINEAQPGLSNARRGAVYQKHWKRGNDMALKHFYWEVTGHLRDLIRKSRSVRDRRNR